MKNPYSAPRSEVRDLEPERKAYWLRTVWFYFGVCAVVSAGAVLLLEPLLMGMTPFAWSVGLVLLALLCAKPLEVLARQRSGTFPWWWDVLFYGVAGLFLVGSSLPDEELMFIAYAAIAGMSLVTVVSTWIVERRHPVRVYSTARGVVFVRLGEP